MMICSKTAIRYLTFITGLFTMALGISLITKSGLGTSPISSVPYVFSMIFPVTFGQLTFLLSFIFLFIEILILRKDFPKEQFLQVLVGPFFGFFTDLGMYIFAYIKPNNYVGKILALLLGCSVLALGVYLQIIANVIINPGEGVVKTIAIKAGVNFGTVKILFDCTLVIIAVIISFLTFGKIKGIREGTVICALLVGSITKIYSYTFEHFKLKEKLKDLLFKNT